MQWSGAARPVARGHRGALFYVGFLGPVHLDLLVVSITLGPIGFDVSLLAVVGVAIAYFVARSIF